MDHAGRVEVIFVEQAIFTSVQSRRARGYHLVAQSPGIPASLAERLNHWGPSHDPLLDPDVDASSVSFFPSEDGWYVLARTGYGGPEYSGRGSLQVVTRFLALRSSHLAEYDQSPLALFHTAMALAHLRLLFQPPERLDEVELPAPTHLGSPRPTDALHASVYETVQRHLRDDGRVAVLSVVRPLDIVARLLLDLPAEERCWLSFTTGLKPPRHRHFRLNLAPTGDPQLVRQYVAQGITCVRSSKPRRSARFGGSVPLLAASRAT